MYEQTTEDNSRSPHRQTLAQGPEVNDQAQIEPYFPSLEDAIEANRASLAQAGQTNHVLLRPDVLEGALGRAQNQYAYTGSMANAAAALAHGVGAAQAFEDGNKRTAYWLTHHFLRENGYGPEVMPDDDEDLADHLIGHGEGRFSMDDTADLFRNRGHISRWTHIVATQDEDAWFDDYVRVALSSQPVDLPKKSIRLGSTNAGWFETTPGMAHVFASGGTLDDRDFAMQLLTEQLAGHGIARVHYSLAWDRSDQKLMKESAWPDIEAKAKRLIQSGKVHVLRNSYNIIAGHVEGDHGDYEDIIHRDDPSSESITLWQCGCKWDQFAWQRTRQWKKYEGRVCAHILALWWQAKGMPLDEEVNPAEQNPTGGPQGEPSPFGGGALPGPQPEPAPGMMAPATAPGPQQPGMPNQQAPMPPQQPPVPGQAPEANEMIPPYPMDPAMMPAVNPVSVPGQKPQSPLNPVQNAGGTFSAMRPISGARVADQQFVNGQMVQLKHEDVGKTVGLGAGNQATIPANSIGEVLGTDPTTKMVNVYFAGPQAQAGVLEPHGVTGWFFPNEIIPRPDVPPAGPAINRRR